MAGQLPMATLGSTELNVTRLGFGAMEIRGAPRGREVTAAQAETILNAVVDSGINYIDKPAGKTKRVHGALSGLPTAVLTQCALGLASRFVGCCHGVVHLIRNKGGQGLYEPLNQDLVAQCLNI